MVDVSSLNILVKNFSMVRMGAEAEYIKGIENLVKPFIDLGIYDSPEKALKDMIKNFAESRMKRYEGKIRRFESKYKTSFPEFTKNLEGKATPKLEDEWMEWESAINMLEAWKKAGREIGLSAAWNS